MRERDNMRVKERVIERERICERQIKREKEYVREVKRERESAALNSVHLTAIHRKEEIFVNGDQQPLAASLSNVITRGKNFIYIYMKERERKEMKTKAKIKTTLPPMGYQGTTHAIPT